MRKVMTMAIAGGTAVVLAGGGLAYGTFGLTKDITLSIDGVEQQIEVHGRTVEDVLNRQGIEVSDRDVVAPTLTSPVSDGTRIAVQYGREVTFTVDGVERTVWTTSTTVEELLAELGLAADKADLSASRSASIGREGLDLSLDTLKKVTVIIKGKPVVIETTGNTVEDALKKAKVKADKDDILSSNKDDLIVNGMKITFVQVDVKTETETKSIGHETEKVKTDDLYTDQTRTKVAGVDGERTLTYKVRYEDGKEVSRKKASDEITRKPVTQVVEVGTKKRPTPPKPKDDGPGYTGGGSKEDWLRASGIAESDWRYVDYIVTRESGWNPNATNPTSGACGLVQMYPCNKAGVNSRDPIANLRWADGYAKSRYGSWAGAYSFWQSNHWW